eukprot:TRINITY_DN7971_c1_g1_i1.p1 TRINITY_DN7971_c1_g1~~TRINITY_DN7971_c1_g1_i1.p1  ORF type:complete len:578 (+),score=138.96 TRINITY_DN7971_c1_g1_i1:67-1800(+)
MRDGFGPGARGGARAACRRRHAARSLAVAVGAAAVAAPAAAQVTLRSCEHPQEAFRVDGRLQGAPCGTVRSVAAAGGGKWLFACYKSAVLCDGDGSGRAAPANCRSVGNLGCAAYVFDLAISADATAVYAACQVEATRCDWDPAAEVPASNCAAVRNAACPGSYMDWVYGIEVAHPSTLLLNCDDTGITACPLAAPGSGSLAAGCKPSGVLPCLQGRNRGISLDFVGKLAVGCAHNHYTYCAFHPEEGPSGCGENLGGWECPGQNTVGITQLDTGHTGIACNTGGYLVCGSHPPRAPRSAAPTAPVQVERLTRAHAESAADCMILAVAAGASLLTAALCLAALEVLPGPDPCWARFFVLQGAALALAWLFYLLADAAGHFSSGDCEGMLLLRANIVALVLYPVELGARYGYMPRAGLGGAAQQRVLRCFIALGVFTSDMPQVLLSVPLWRTGAYLRLNAVCAVVLLLSKVLPETRLWPQCGGAGAAPPPRQGQPCGLQIGPAQGSACEPSPSAAHCPDAGAGSRGTTPPPPVELPAELLPQPCTRQQPRLAQRQGAQSGRQLGPAQGAPYAPDRGAV